MATGYRGRVNDPEREPSSDVTLEDPITGSAHYFTSAPESASRRSQVTLSLPDLTIDLVTDRGVFSPGRIDPGTKLLLSEVPELPPGPVLDLGCGYGPIATTLAIRRPDQPIWAVDVNDRALDLCRENLASHAPSAVANVCTPDEVPVEQRFMAIVSNPPIRVGKAALHQMLEHWLGRLDVSGEAWLVVHRHLGGDSLAEWMRGRRFEVERARSRQGYRILRVTSGD